MKKLLILGACLLALTGTIWASGKGETEVKGEDDAAYIAVISKGFQHEFWQAVRAGAVDAGKELGIRITYEGPANESMLDVQINMVENAITTKADGLLLAALDSEALIPYVKKAVDNGMVVATFDSGVKSDIPVSFVATNNLNAGGLAADNLAKLIGNKGKVGVIVHDATSQTGIERRDGFLKRVAEKYPDITVLEPIYGGGDHDKSANLIVDMIWANPDLVGIFAGNEGSAVGAGIAIKEMGKKDNIVLIGFDSGQLQIDFLAEGIIDGFVSQDPYNIGNLGVKTLAKAMAGEKVDKLYDTGCVYVDSTNINDPEVQRILYH